MFLVTIQKTERRIELKRLLVTKLNLDSLIINIAVDGFWSKLISGVDGFTIALAPFNYKHDSKDLLLAKIEFNKSQRSAEVFRTTMAVPIYYHLNTQGEFFCSTHIFLLRKAGVKIEENRDVLPEFFVYRVVAAPNTLYKNIKQIFSGGKLYLKIEKDKCIITSIHHFNPPQENKNVNSIKDSSRQIFELISNSIKRLEEYKEETAILLSGGIDSSTMSKICQKDLRINESYSTAYPFEEPSLNIEKQYALSAAKALGMNHHYYQTEIRDYLIGFLETISLIELPLHHLQSVCFHLLFKNGIPSAKKILISGQAPGLPYGNFRNFLFMKDKIIVKLFSVILLKKILEILSLLSGRGKKFLAILNDSTSKLPLDDPHNPIWSWRDYGSKKWVCDYFNVKEWDIIKERYNLIKPFREDSIYNIWSMYDVLGEGDSTLSIWAKTAEANKRIFYCPLYREEILNYVFSLPWKLKLKSPPTIYKIEIARLAGVPEFIISRRKTGFGIKRKDWALKDNIFSPLVQLASKEFDIKEIKKLQSLDSKKAMTFWNILNYSIWKRLCINGEPLNDLIFELEGTIKK